MAGVENPHIAFAIKANPNLAVLKVLAREGYGADVVSGRRNEPGFGGGHYCQRISCFLASEKPADEIIAALKKNIGQFNIESEEEGRELSALAEIMGKRADAVLRINPDVDAQTNAKISTGKADNKFGIGLHKAHAIYARLALCPGSTCAVSLCISAASC